MGRRSETNLGGCFCSVCWAVLAALVQPRVRSFSIAAVSDVGSKICNPSDESTLSRMGVDFAWSFLP